MQALEVRRTSMNNPSMQPAAGSSFSRPAALIGGAVALVAVTAIATTLAIKPSTRADADAGASVAAQSLASASTKASGEVGDEGAAKKPAPALAERSPAPTKAAAKPAPAKVAAAACASCGVIESVTSFEKKGEGSGVGAVGGAVVGGLLGNQMGSGSGKKAMTVIGAVGGGMAGNEIEKRQRATTLYSVKVRMDDGSLRTVTQSTAPTVGQKVTVEGSTIKARA
jgi:outer membrane lipoprotein SlyB